LHCTGVLSCAFLIAAVGLERHNEFLQLHLGITVSETSHSLLERLRQPPSDEAAWKRLVDLYTPLIHQWLRRYDVQPQDVDDLTQEVLRTVHRELPRFEHNRHLGAFRSWLRTIAANRIRAFWKKRRTQAVGMADSEADRRLAELEDPASGLSHLWDQEHDRYVLRRLLELVEPEFAPSTWQAFQRLAVDGRPAAEVAAELGTTVNAVLLAKSRVLRRLRQEARGLVD
jgi:RNA polymerase sigma factor (sigma-70 family)